VYFWFASRNGLGWLRTKILETFHAVNLHINKCRKWLSAVIKGARSPQEILSKWAAIWTEGGPLSMTKRTRVSVYLSAGQCCLRIWSPPVWRVIGSRKCDRGKISHCMMLDYHFCLVGAILGAAELLVFIGAWPDL
jgi:hypothetical protein